MAALHNIELKSKRGKLVYGVIIAILSIGIPIQIFPLAWSISNCFKHPIDIESPIPSFFVANPNWNGFADTFVKYKLMQNFANSLVLCVVIILLQVTVSAMAAYALSVLKPRFGNLVLLLFVGTMMISPQAIMFPLYLMVVRWKLLDTMWSLILPSIAWGYSIFLFKGFFDGIPGELVDAANIDGAGYVRIFTTIVVPLAKPVFVVNCINTFVAVYNDIVMPYMFLPSEKNWTVMVRIFVSMNGNYTTKNVIFIMSVLATIPLVVLYLVFQRYITQGITMSGLKG